MDKETKQMFEVVLQKLDGLVKTQENMQIRQDEMYILQRGLEENAKVSRAQQEKMMYTLADIQGNATKLTVEVENHENVIDQIRAKKLISI